MTRATKIPGSSGAGTGPVSKHCPPASGYAGLNSGKRHWTQRGSSGSKHGRKTGTSQTGQLNEQQEEILNAWFGGYLPAANPRWAIVVLVEEGISGAESAAPVFKDVAQSLIQLYPTGG